MRCQKEIRPLFWQQGREKECTVKYRSSSWRYRDTRFCIIPCAVFRKVQKYGFTKVSAVIPGGKERYDSVYAGLCECRDCEYVLIHDGARPFVTEEILKRGLQKVKETGACVIGMPSKDTVKLSDEEGYVKETPNRKCVWTIQTPQIFSYSLIREAHDSIRQKDMSKITDDAMVVEQETGAKVALAEGSYQNIKITTPEDLDIAEAFLKH